MFKALLRIIVVLLILTITGIGGVYFYAGNIVKKAVETFVPQITQTTASLDNMSLSLLKGKMTILGLTIGNPDGFNTPNAFSLNSISISFIPETLFQDKMIINQVLIEGTQVSAEATYQNGKMVSNLTQIQKNVDAFIKQHATAKTPVQPNIPVAKKTEPVPPQQNKQVIIKDLQINNSVLTLGLMNQTLTLSLPNIQKKNIGEGRKITWQDSIVFVLNLISDETVKASVKAAQQLLQQGATTLLNKTSGTLDITKDQTENVTENVMDTVKNLF